MAASRCNPPPSCSFTLKYEQVYKNNRPIVLDAFACCLLSAHCSRGNCLYAKPQYMCCRLRSLTKDLLYSLAGNKPVIIGSEFLINTIMRLSLIPGLNRVGRGKWLMPEWLFVTCKSLNQHTKLVKTRRSGKKYTSFSGPICRGKLREEISAIVFPSLSLRQGFICSPLEWFTLTWIPR